MLSVNPKTKVMVVLGARREAIKAAPIIERLRRRNSEFEPIVVAIALAREVFAPVLSHFDALPNIVLNLRHIRQGLPSLTSHVLENMTVALEREKPDILLTEGNSPAAFACSLAAYHQKIPVAHITSYTGHGAFDHPSPENVNRRLTAVLAEMHFASTRLAKHCLINEGIDEKRIAVTGNPLIEAMERLSATPFLFQSACLQKATSDKKRIVLFSIHTPDPAGQSRQAVFGAAHSLVHKFADLEVIVADSTETGGIGDGFGWENNRIHRIEAPDDMTFIHLLKNSHVIVSDSNEIPEEASAFRKPVLILENSFTAMPGVYTRSVKTVNCNSTAIARETGLLLSNADARRRMMDLENPYGDGQASERIVTAIKHRAKDSHRILSQAEEFSPRTPLTDLLCRNL